MTEERRKHPRVDVTHPVLYYTRLYPNPRLTRTFNLSLGGIAIQTPYYLMTGQTIEMTIAIHPRVINCTGRVVHILTQRDKLLAGIQFEQIAIQNRVYLEEHIVSLLKRQNEGRHGVSFS